MRDHELLVNSSRNFEISTANKFQQAETQLRELRSEMQTSNLALGTANDKIEADLLFQKQSHEQNLELHTHYIEETSNSLDQMFSHQVSVFQAQLEEQLHLCEDACTKGEHGQRPMGEHTRRLRGAEDDGAGNATEDARRRPK